MASGGEHGSESLLERGSRQGADDSVELVSVGPVAARGRATLIIAGNEPQEVRLVRPLDKGGYGLDALWNDDFHHTARVALTGRNEAYFTDYKGTPQEFISAAKWGYLYQGQRYAWQKKRRGTPTFGLPPATFVTFLENHDQVANSAYGKRLHQVTSPGRYRALTTLLLLGPNTPMLFQGEEFGASAPFLYFADHQGELAEAVAKGRRDFLNQFRSIRPIAEGLARPDDPRTFETSKLDHDDRDEGAVALHRDSPRLLRQEAALRGHVECAVIGPDAFAWPFFEKTGDRLLVVLARPGELAARALGTVHKELENTEPRLAHNHLWYRQQLKKLASDPRTITVKNFKYSNGTVVLDAPEVGKPVFGETIPGLDKSYEQYLTDLKEAQKSVDEAVNDIKKVIDEQRKPFRGTEADAWFQDAETIAKLKRGVANFQKSSGPKPPDKEKNSFISMLEAEGARLKTLHFKAELSGLISKVKSL